MPPKTKNKPLPHGTRCGQTPLNLAASPEGRLMLAIVTQAVSDLAAPASLYELMTKDDSSPTGFKRTLRMIESQSYLSAASLLGEDLNGFLGTIGISMPIPRHILDMASTHRKKAYQFVRQLVREGNSVGDVRPIAARNGIRLTPTGENSPCWANPQPCDCGEGLERRLFCHHMLCAECYYIQADYRRSIGMGRGKKYKPAPFSSLAKGRKFTRIRERHWLLASITLKGELDRLLNMGSHKCFDRDIRDAVSRRQSEYFEYVAPK